MGLGTALSKVVATTTCLCTEGLHVTFFLINSGGHVRLMAAPVDSRDMGLSHDHRQFYWTAPQYFNFLNLRGGSGRKKADKGF